MSLFFAASDWHYSVETGLFRNCPAVMLQSVNYHYFENDWQIKSFMYATVTIFTKRSKMKLPLHILGVASSIPGRSHNFAEIDQETMKSFLRPFSSLEGLLSVTSESMCTKYWLTA